MHLHSKLYRHLRWIDTIFVYLMHFTLRVSRYTTYFVSTVLSVANHVKKKLKKKKNPQDEGRNWQFEYKDV